MDLFVAVRLRSVNRRRRVDEEEPGSKLSAVKFCMSSEPDLKSSYLVPAISFTL